MSTLIQEQHNSSETVTIASLKPGESPRLSGESNEHIRMLASLEADLPAILVHRPTMRVIDGMHRLKAAKLRGKETIDVQFINCDEKDIFIAAVSANIKHGLPLSLADRQAAAGGILVLHPEWSDRRIADATGLSHKTVGMIRNRISGDKPQLHGREGRDGKVRPLHTTDRRMAAADLMRKNPATSLRQVANAIGLSVGTVRDVRVRLERGEDPAARRPPGGWEGGAAVDRRRRGVEEGSPARTRRMSGRRSPTKDATAILLNLSKDPAIRLNATGREMLQLLHTCTRCIERLDALTSEIPPHHLASVADLAKQNAKLWLDLAGNVEQRR